MPAATKTAALERQSAGTFWTVNRVPTSSRVTRPAAMWLCPKRSTGVSGKNCCTRVPSIPVTFSTLHPARCMQSMQARSCWKSSRAAIICGWSCRGGLTERAERNCVRLTQCKSFIGFNSAICFTTRVLILCTVDTTY